MCHGMDTEVRGQDCGALPLPPPYMQIPRIELRLPGLSDKCPYPLSHLTDLLFFQMSTVPGFVKPDCKVTVTFPLYRICCCLWKQIHH